MDLLHRETGRSPHARGPGKSRENFTRKTDFSETRGGTETHTHTPPPRRRLPLVTILSVLPLPELFLGWCVNFPSLPRNPAPTPFHSLPRFPAAPQTTTPPGAAKHPWTSARPGAGEGGGGGVRGSARPPPARRGGSREELPGPGSARSPLSPPGKGGVQALPSAGAMRPPPPHPPRPGPFKTPPRAS